MKNENLNSQCVNSKNGNSEFENNFIQNLNYGNFKNEIDFLKSFLGYVKLKFPKVNFTSINPKIFSLSEQIEQLNNSIKVNPFLLDSEKSEINNIFSRMYDAYFEFLEFKISKIQKNYLLTADLKELLNNLYNIPPKNSDTTITKMQKSCLKYKYIPEIKRNEIEKVFFVYLKRENSIFEFGGENITLNDIGFYKYMENVKRIYHEMNINELVFNVSSIKTTCLTYLCEEFNVAYFPILNRGWKKLKKLFYKRLIRNISPVVIDTVFSEFKKLFFECLDKMKNIPLDDYSEVILTFLKSNFDINQYTISKIRNNVFECLKWRKLDDEMRYILSEFCDCYNRKLKKQKTVMEKLQNEYEDSFNFDDVYSRN